MDVAKEEEHVLSSTYSVCPECLKRIPAQRVARGDAIYLQKYCPEHGRYQVRIWQGKPDYTSWNRMQSPERPETHDDTTTDRCPADCGLCPEHRQQTCCVLLEVTKHCNLDCPVCFAAADRNTGDDPTLQEIKDWFRMLLESGGPFNIQLSGGEPTLRDDLPEIIAIGRKLGFGFFQVNTNGLRLAADEVYVKRLKEAGLDCVFLQFDGISDDVYAKLRGKPLLSIKKKVIAMCCKYDLGVVLVPTLVPKINVGQIGDIIQFAIHNMPTIRGVHFQPISYFGRYPQEPRDEDRITIPELLRHIEEQTKGQMKAIDFSPPNAEHATCSFHGSFLLLPDGAIQVFPGIHKACCAPGVSDGQESKRARQFVARQWAAAKKAKAGNQAAHTLLAGDVSSLDDFLARVGKFTLAISGMAFQDAWNLDVERLKQCFIHVVAPDKKLIPFCAYNLTDRKGQALYRRR